MQTIGLTFPEIKQAKQPKENGKAQPKSEPAKK